VALRLLPGRWRRDLFALYGFARLVDDVGDEYPGDRLAALDALEAELDLAFQGCARHPLLKRLEPTLRAHDLPRRPFARLIEANRLDQRKPRLAGFAELRTYCALSADPVGELVLGVFGEATPENVALSDAICSALQIVEHLQDVAEDFAAGRVYLPAEDLARFGCTEADLARVPAPTALRRVVAFEAGRAQALLREGEPLIAKLSQPARTAVAGFAAGGWAALAALVRGRYEVTTRCWKPRRRDVALQTARLLWRARARGVAR
jgi:squalene synthase HpnC